VAAGVVVVVKKTKKALAALAGYAVLGEEVAGFSF
jgi:hypothetical protein